MVDFSYHDLYITTKEIDRTSIMNLPFGILVQCNRVGGWEVWQLISHQEFLLGGEFSENGLILDVNGYVIVDSLTKKE